MQVLKQHKLTVNEYFSIGELPGKTELIDGVIYDMVPPGANHSYSVGEIFEILIRSLSNVVIRQEQPVQFLFDAPQPDIAVLKRTETKYKEHHPEAKDVILIIEVSDSTLKYDTDLKMKMYAKENIPLYFVVDLKNKVIIKHTNPVSEGYKDITDCKEIKIDGLSTAISINSIL